MIETTSEGQVQVQSERDALGRADTLADPGTRRQGDALGDADAQSSDDRESLGAAAQARTYETLFRRAAAPRQLGRYVVLDSLGQGGMGVVLRAYDRELDRTVALKVLHREIDRQHAQRLRREAQAMAKLSHPNVVQVYEVGEIEGQTFVAMELVKGQTVRQWMDRRPRPGWRTCVELFVQLGAGLLAAHEQGLVHRDFKPGNAIVDDKGRARVLDFGLARLDDEVDDGPSVMVEEARTDSHAAVSLESSLTATGAVLGTPAYMPPEQMDGLEADARSDQFSFCVSLYEAVYGERPYAGRSMMAIMVSMRSGSVQSAPKGSNVPAALRKVLLRGLSVVPAERWPSMEALLEQLRRIVAPRRWRWMALALGVGLVAVGGGLGATQTLEWLNRCTGARKQLEGVWDDARRQEVKAAILGTGLSYAPGTWERVEPRLDEYADAWATEHTETCEATRSRDEQSEEEMSLRMGCLRQRRQHVQATVNELAHADATVVEHAVRAVTSLPGLERCRDLEALRAEVPPPEDPAVADQVAALDERLVEASAKKAAGKYVEALRVVDEVVEQGAELHYEPLMARAWLLQGGLRDDTGDYEGAAAALRDAYVTAVARRMSAEAAQASMNLVMVSGIALMRQDEGRSWLIQAEPMSRAAGTDEARAAYFNVLGVLTWRQAQYDEAREALLSALAIKERLYGPDDPATARALANLGVLASSQGNFGESRDFNERALASLEKALGPDHPDVAIVLVNLANVVEEPGPARDLGLRALAIREKALGPDHPAVAASLNNNGTAAYKLGNLEEARDFYERALAINEKVLGLEHPDLTIMLGNLGSLAAEQGKLDEAREFHQRALTINEKALGPDHPDVADNLARLGGVALLQGKLDEARDLELRALAIVEKALGPEHPELTLSLGNLGGVARAQGKLDEAFGLYERVLAIQEKTLGPDHHEVAPTLVSLGSVLHEQGKLDEARDFHERALAMLEKAHGPVHPSLADPLMGLGKVLLDRDQPGQALVPLERALALRTSYQVEPGQLAVTRFALARALWEASVADGRDRPRARTLAEQAREGYAVLGEAKKHELAEAEAWLADTVPGPEGPRSR